MCFINPTNCDQKKTKQFQKQVGRIGNMKYEPEEDCFTCIQGKKLTLRQEKTEVRLRLDSDTFYINHVTAVMVDNLRRLLLGINLSDKAVMDFDFPGVGFPV